MVRPTVSRLSLVARRQPHPLLVLHPEVQAALASRASTSSRPATPLVALESTIITHGMPYPTNLSTARRVEDQVRSQGAIPATIALLDGKIHVGCDESQLERLAESAQVKGQAFKTGRRDLAGVLARRTIGGTTVSGTALVAHMAGINIFATGGIGGVHRGAERSWDVSSDLTELSRTPLNIFCSGAKSILDIPLTLEYLETQGVSTYSFNPSGEFPAFYTAKSGMYATPVQDAGNAAEIILQGERYGLQSGSVFGVPIPSECEADGAEIQKAVELAVTEAKELGVDKKGKEVTPWLLARVGQLTKGTSLKSNVELVVNNAGTAARTAKAYEALRWETEKRGEGQGKLFNGFEAGGGSTSLRTSEANSTNGPDLLIIGCAALDVVSRSTTLNPASTSRGSVRFSLGGVGRNMAEAAHKVLASASTSDIGDKRKTSAVRMIAPLADDAAGTLVRAGLQKLGMDITGLFIPPLSAAAAVGQAEASSSRSPVCSLHLDGANDLVTGVADMALVEEALTPEMVRGELQRAVGQGGGRVIAFDANLTAEAMSEVIQHKVDQDDARLPRPILFFEPTSTAKCTRIIDALALAGLQSSSPGAAPSIPPIDFTTPNLIELEAMVARAGQLGLISPQEVPSPPAPSLSATTTAADVASSDLEVEETQKYIRALCESLAPFFGRFLVTMGERGVLSATPTPVGSSMSSSRLHFTLHPSPGASSSSSSSSSTGVKGSKVNVVSTTGAGDTFAGAVLAGLCLRLSRASSTASRDTSSSASGGDRDPATLSVEALSELIQLGQRAAILTLQSQEAVAEDLGGALLGLELQGEARLEE